MHQFLLSEELFFNDSVKLWKKLLLVIFTFSEALDRKSLRDDQTVVWTRLMWFVDSRNQILDLYAA